MIFHDMDTEQGRKVNDNLGSLPRKMWEMVQQELQTMIERGVIEESHSEWRSPIMFIHKLDGLMWFCINFWKINTISKFNMYPMPRINELLGILEAAKYISTL